MIDLKDLRIYIELRVDGDFQFTERGAVMTVEKACSDNLLETKCSIKSGPRNHDEQIPYSKPLWIDIVMNVPVSYAELLEVDHLLGALEQTLAESQGSEARITKVMYDHRSYRLYAFARYLLSKLARLSEIKFD